MGRTYKVGDWVEVRNKDEILTTLDSNGQLDGMPFQPEMFAFCGKQFAVLKSAHKTCDPDFRSRRIRNAVHLQTRCDGSAHGGCQAGCLFFWNEAWLKPAADNASVLVSSTSRAGSVVECPEPVVWERSVVKSADGEILSYHCQTTQVQFEEPLDWWDVRQYFEDYWFGNITFGRLLSGTIYSFYFHLTHAGFGGPTLRRLYNWARPLWRGVAWPRTPGLIPAGQPTPTIDLNLQPGELVRVKSHEEILKTVNTHNKNRGLWWDAELVPYCGQTFRVHSRVTKVLDEKTGVLLVMQNPSIILDNVVCQARYSECRMFCPRNTYAYWREIWLERVEPLAPRSEN